MSFPFSQHTTRVGWVVCFVSCCHDERRVQCSVCVACGHAGEAVGEAGRRTRPWRGDVVSESSREGFCHRFSIIEDATTEKMLRLPGRAAV